MTRTFTFSIMALIITLKHMLETKVSHMRLFDIRSTIISLRICTSIAILVDFSDNLLGDEGNQFVYRPYMTRDARLHGRSYPQAFVNSHEIVPSEVQCHSRL